MFLNKEKRAALYVLVANVFFGINFSFVKQICSTSNTYGALIGPFALNIYRVTLSTLLFWVLYFLMPDKEIIKKKDVGRFLICAVTGVIINQTLFIKGLSLTSTIHASLLILATPIFITLLAWLVLKEKITIFKVIGLIIALSGAVLLAFQKENVQFGSNTFLGDIYVMINAISYAIYFVLVKPLMLQYKPLTVIRWIFTFALPGMWIIGFNEFNQVQFTVWQPTHYVALFEIVIGATFIAYLCTTIALQNIGAARTGSFIYLQPFIATFIAIVFLDDILTWQKLLAGACIMFGIFLINKVNATNGVRSNDISKNTKQ